jgi:hypothetical protein
MFLSPPPSTDEQQSFPLAYIIEGVFPSYFEGKPIPEKTSDETDTEESNLEVEAGAQKETVDMSKIKGRGDFIPKGKPAKIFLMASSEMLRDTVLDPEGDSPNDMFVLNTIDALNQRQHIATMRSKTLRFNPLHDTGAVTKTFVKSFNIAGLPVLVVFLGLIIWLRRHSRKKRIQMMFQK